MADDFAPPSLQDAGLFANVASGAGSIISGFGAYENAEQKKNADLTNAKIAGSNADLVGAETASNAQQTAYKQQLQEGEERASMGESGTGGASTGTNLRVMQQSEMQNNMTLLNSQFAGTVKRYSLLDQQTMDNYSAGVQQTNANTSLINTGISTTSTLLKGASQYFNSSGF